MKRMKPDEYRLEALTRVNRAIKDLTQRFGEWNRQKIEAEMERLLRDKRRNR